jgi:PAS domain S-box-containing protein
MPQIFLQIFAAASFIPHGHCYLWNSRLVWLHIASDSIVALAYYSIPITLIYFVRKRSDLPYAGIFLLFGAFIISCGTTHVMEIWTLWHPNYWTSGLLKAITAFISFYTALALIPIIPKALALQSPTQLKEANRILEQEIAERQRVEKRLSLQSATALILAESGSFMEAAPKLLQTICSHLGWDWGELWGFNQNDFDIQPNPYLSTMPLRCLQIWHSPSVDFSEFEAKTRQITFLPGEGLPGRVWATQKAAWVEDIVRDNNFLRQTVAQKEGLHGGFAFPIRLESQILGVFSFFSRNIRQNQSELLELFDTLGSQIGQFIARKRAEKALQNSQLLLSGVLNSSLDGIMAFQSVRDRQNNIVDFQWLIVNPAAEKIVGRSHDELFNKRLLEELPGNRETGLFDLYVRVVETGEPIEREFYYNHDGIDSWFLNTAVKLGDGFAVTFRDISERKQAEAAIRESQERFRLAFNDAATGMTLVSPEGRFLQVNHALCDIVGYSETELLATDFQTITHPEDLDADLEYVAQLLAGEISTYQMEKRYIHKLGHIVWIVLCVSLVRSESGQPLYFIAQIQNISERQAALRERKNAEQALKENEERLQLALEASGDGLWDWNIPNDEVYLSKQWIEMLGYEVGELVANVSTWESLIHPDDRSWVMELLNAHLKDGSVSYAFDYRVLTKSGEWKWIANYGKVVTRDKNNQPLRMTGTHKDISDRKRFEEQIAASLTEKEVLLKEIHHRVKNNLQIICSLLNLQARSLKNSTITTLFKETQNRVRSMALVHEKLYQSNNLSQINLGEYLQDLANNLFRSYSINSSRIILKTNFENQIFLDVDVAVSCGLIINELVSNTLKYAFGSGEKGEVFIQTGLDEEKNIVLIIRDNGKGLPDDLDLEKTQTLGLKLVNNLIDQLRGKLELNNSLGTEFKIIFNKKDDK